MSSCLRFVFFFKQKTAYEMRISDWSSDVCSSDLFNVNQKPELYPLDRNRTLVMLPCGAGAYNFSSAALIVTGKVGKREFTAPIFDLQPGWGMKEDGYHMLVNYGWDAARSTLSSYTRGDRKSKRLNSSH